MNFDDSRFLPTLTKLPRDHNKGLSSSFVSPELCAREIDQFGYKADIWSIGMLVHTMLTRNIKADP